jgi:hypothetical protein
VGDVQSECISGTLDRRTRSNTHVNNSTGLARATSFHATHSEMGRLPPPAAATGSASASRLSLLHLLHLLRVPLMHLLRLLLVLLFNLLHSRRSSLLFRQLLMFRLLLLLQFLPILVLLRDHIVLLLLVFLVQLRVPRLGSSGSLDGR